ncbi:MAG: hypothetical protein ACRCXB_20430 [Aeromonadaceae bacterium]
MNMRLKSVFIKLLFTPVVIFFAFTFFSFVNGIGCNYELKLPTENNIESFAVCRWGMINVVDTDTITHEQWTVSAINFSFSNQVYMHVIERRKTNSGTSGVTSLLEKTHQSHRNISLYHYAWVAIDEENIFLFQTLPKDEVYLAKKNGFLDFWERYVGAKKLTQ